MVQEGLTIEEMYLMSGHPRVTLSGGNKPVVATGNLVGAIPERDAIPLYIQATSYLKTSYAVSHEAGRLAGLSAPYGIGETIQAFCRLNLLKTGQSVGAKTVLPDSMYYAEMGFGRRRIFLRLDCKGCINRLDMLEYKRSYAGTVPACDGWIERTT